MSDNQRKLVVAINLVNRLSDLVEKKLISLDKMEEVVHEVYGSLEDADMVEQFLGKAQAILNKEKVKLTLSSALH